MAGVEPQKLLLRRRDVLEWTGISLAEFKKLVASQVIKGRKLRENGRSYYDKSHIKTVCFGSK